MRTKLLSLLFLSGLFFWPTQGRGQTMVIDETFYNIDTGGEKPKLMVNPSPGFEDWTFEGICYAINGEYLQIGNKSGNSGSITTKQLGVSGDVRFFIVTENLNSGGASFSATVSGGGKIGDSTYKEYSMASLAESSKSILISDVTPTTTITIANVNKSRFYVKDIVAYILDDLSFYESFSLMRGNDNIEFDIHKTLFPSASNCDNSGSVFGSDVYIKQSYRSIWFSDNSYTMPAVSSVVSGQRYLLSFKIAGYNGYTTPQLTISCNDATNLSQFNTMSVADVSGTRTKTVDDFKTWHENYVVLTGMSNTTKITFSGECLFLDEIKLKAIPSNLDQAKDNSLFIEAYNGETRDVTLSRTLTGNIWCPLCLPFDITPAKMEATLGTCEVRTLTSATGGLFTFDVVASETTVPAGTPFLVKVPSTIVNPTFSAVMIKNTAATEASASTSEYKFVGTYSPVELTTDGTNLFLGTDGNLYRPGTTEGYNRLGGLRAYFVVKDGASARIAIKDDASAIDAPRSVTVTADSPLYDLSGRQIRNSQPKRGLYLRNGRKFFVN